MKTLVASHEPDRPRNATTWTNGTNTTATGNARVDWIRLNVNR